MSPLRIRRLEVAATVAKLVKATCTTQVRTQSPKGDFAVGWCSFQLPIF
jgi:hypothetical protein